MSRMLDNWIKTYVAYTNESESPEIFHIWIGISLIASVLRRRVWISHGYWDLYPNFYVLLVSPPGRCKKSTAMRTGRQIVEPVDGIQYSVDSTTRENLIADMTRAYHDGHSALTSHSSEFATLLTSSGMDMVAFLTDIFDSPSVWTHKTKMSGPSKIIMPHFNFLGATTPDWISRAMPLDTIGIGLMSRIVAVYSDKPRIRDAIPKVTSEHRELAKLLTEDLAAMSLLAGEYEWDTVATYEFYNDWYRSREHDPKRNPDPRMEGYYERKHIHMLKLAMCIAASQSDTLLISEQNIKDALELLELTESSMDQVFAGVGRNPLQADMQQLLVTLRTHPNGLHRNVVMSMFRHNVDGEQLDRLLSDLSASGEISINGSMIHAVYLPPALLT